MTRVLLALLLFTGVASPAAAASYPNCLGGGGGSPGLSVHFGISVGSGELSEADEQAFDKIRLRRAGIIADTVERTWLECLKVTRFENGRWVMEFYHPDRLEDGPLQLERR